MAPLTVDPAALSSAGAAVISAGDGVATATGTLTSGAGANLGQDSAGEAFALSYQDGAKSVLKAVAAGINACHTVGFKIELGASNYSRAEASSTLGGGGATLPAPAPPGNFDVPGAPWTLGPGVAEPALWGLVEEFVGDLWPNGNPGQIHAAAGCWRSFAATLQGVQRALQGPKSVVAGQHIPEGELIQQAFSKLGDAMGKIGDECGKLAKGLDDFADEVQHAQSAIRDLLHRLDTPSGLLHEVFEVFKGHGLDEIRKIADDIKAILHNMKREADAKEQLFQQAMGLMDSCAVGLEAFAKKELTHFLGEDVGSAASAYVDSQIDIGEGLLKGAADAAHSLSQLNPLRFAYDPNGALHSWQGLGKLAQMAANPAAIPAQLASDPKGTLDMVEGLVDYKDWSSDRPLVGLGHNIFDVGTAVVPGVGELGAGAKAAETAGAATRAADAADVAGTVGRDGRMLDEAGELASTTGTKGGVGSTASGLAKDLDKIGADFPKSDPAPGGRPASLSSPKAGEPGVAPPPSPVEPAPTVSTAADPRPAPQATAPTTPPEATPAPGGSHQPALALAGPEPAPSGAAPAGPLPSYGAEPSPHAPVPSKSALADVHSTQPAPPSPHQMAPQGAHAGTEHAPDPPLPADGSPPGGGDGGVNGSGIVGGESRDGNNVGSSGHGHVGGDGQVTSVDDAAATGLSDAKRDEILAMEKGRRPDPSEYLSPEYIEHHLDKFHEGVSRFMPETNLEKYGIAQRDGTCFIMPKSEADALIASTGGDPRAMERALGLVEGFLDSNKVVRIDIDHAEQFNLRVPSGNEAGANEQWIPGGKLPDGASEAVIDGGNVPKSGYSVDDALE